MSARPRLTLYYHPLSSFCQKVLIALYENDTPFTPRLIDFGDPEDVAALKNAWPLRKFPVLRDEGRDWMVPESSIIIEYLDQHYPGRVALIPEEKDLARQTRMHDRFFDLHVQVPMQKIVGDRLRPEGNKDPFGVAEARRQLETALDMIDEGLAGKTWAMGEAFTMADCAAAPALYYADRVAPFGSRANVVAYFERLMERPSFARAVEEAEPYRHLFPG